jgi:hypothetical protein
MYLFIYITYNITIDESYKNIKKKYNYKKKSCLGSKFNTKLDVIEIPQAILITVGYSDSSDLQFHLRLINF